MTSSKVNVILLDESVETFEFDPRSTTGRSNWILHRIWKYYIGCLRDVLLK